LFQSDTGAGTNFQATVTNIVPPYTATFWWRQSSLPLATYNILWANALTYDSGSQRFNQSSGFWAPGTVINTDTWYFVAVQVDDAGGGTSPRLYLGSESSAPVEIAQTSLTYYDIDIIGISRAVNGLRDGYLDDVMIYDSFDLTSSQINDIWNETK